MIANTYKTGDSPVRINQELVIRPVENGGFVISARTPEAGHIEPKIVAAFSNGDDMLAGLADTFGSREYRLAPQKPVGQPMRGGVGGGT